MQIFTPFVKLTITPPIPLVKKRCSKGQMLIEVVISVGLMSATLLAIAGMVTSALKIATHNKRKAIASNLGKESLEILRAMRDNGEFSFFTATTSKQFFRLNFRLNSSGAAKYGWFLEGAPLCTKSQTGTEKTNAPFCGTDDFYAITYSEQESLVLPKGSFQQGQTQNDQFGTFYRQIIIEPANTSAPHPDKKKVTVALYFYENNSVNEVTFSTVLTNWKSPLGR